MADSIQSLIQGISRSKTILVGKASSCGMFTPDESQTAKLSDVASRFNDMPVHDCENFDIKVGETRSIDPGYHKGCTITGVGHDGVTTNYALQYDIVVDSPEPDATASKMVTLANNGDPNNYYGMGSVFVKPLGPQYIDTSNADISVTKDTESGEYVSPDLLVDKIAYGKDARGNAIKIKGAMPNKSGYHNILCIDDPEIQIPKGYHDGTGYFSIFPESAFVEPSEETQRVEPGDFGVLSYVDVGPIPAKYKDTSDADITRNIVNGIPRSPELLSNVKAYGRGGIVYGSMEKHSNTEYTDVKYAFDIAYDNGDGDSGTMDECVFVIPKGYHDNSTKVAPEAYHITHEPSETSKTYKAENGKVISQVIVYGIPGTYSKISGTTAAADHVLEGQTFFSEVNGHRQMGTGTIPINEKVNTTVNDNITSVKISKGYYREDGYVKFDDSTIIAALQAI